MYVRALFVLLAAIALAGLGACNSAKPDDNGSDQVGNRYEAYLPYPNATSVRLFVNAEGLSESGEWQISDTKGRLLSLNERKQFEKNIKLYRPKPDEEQLATACFFPHHFFRYYDQSGKFVGEIAVCFCCAQAQASPEFADVADDRWIEYDFPGLYRFVEGLGLPTEVNCEEED